MTNSCSPPLNPPFQRRISVLRGMLLERRTGLPGWWIDSEVWSIITTTVSYKATRQKRMRAGELYRKTTVFRGSRVSKSQSVERDKDLRAHEGFPSGSPTGCQKVCKRRGVKNRQRRHQYGCCCKTSRGGWLQTRWRPDIQQKWNFYKISELIPLLDKLFKWVRRAETKRSSFYPCQKGFKQKFLDL